MSEHLERLRAMTADGQQTWDLSEKDVAALKVARDALALVESAKGAKSLDVYSTMDSEGGIAWVGRASTNEVRRAPSEAEAREGLAARLVATAIALRGGT